MFWAHFNFRSFSALQSTLHFKLDGHFVNATVLLSDLLAGNGMIHVIDKIMWHVEDYHETSSVSKCLVSNFLQSAFVIFFSDFLWGFVEKRHLGSGFLSARFMEIIYLCRQLISFIREWATKIWWSTWQKIFLLKSCFSVPEKCACLS